MNDINHIMYLQPGDWRADIVIKVEQTHFNPPAIEISKFRRFWTEDTAQKEGGYDVQWSGYYLKKESKIVLNKEAAMSLLIALQRIFI